MLLIAGPVANRLVPQLARAHRVSHTATSTLGIRNARAIGQRNICTGRGTCIVLAGLAEDIQKKNADNAVVVYSKTWCPYCSQVKSLFDKLGVSAKVIELDQLEDGDVVQDTLSTITGRRTVPQVFIGGAFVGGCDDTMAAYSAGKLKQLFADAGVAISG